MAKTIDGKAKPKSRTRRDPAAAGARWLDWVARERGKAPFLCRSFPRSDRGFAF